jgi:hypothetical protein
MAALTTMAQAETLVKTRVANGQWLPGAHSCAINGSPGVRFQRFMSPSAPDAGGWVESTADDAL